MSFDYDGDAISDSEWYAAEDDLWERNLDNEDYVLENSLNCMVYNCRNFSDQGKGIFIKVIINDNEYVLKWMCMPCFEFMMHGFGKHSQLYRNAKEKNNERRSN